MRSLFDNEVRHLPQKIIPAEDSFYLGYVENNDVRLVIEEGEFRVYNYEWWSWESINENHYDEWWWVDIGEYFGGGCDCMDRDTCQYSVVEFDSKDAVDMAIELANVCTEELEDTSYVREDNERVRQNLVDFIRRWMWMVDSYKNSFVYYYYK